VDYNRVCLLLAVLEKRLGLKFSACDVYLNVIGGLRLDEPAADAAVCFALISSLRDIPVPDDAIAFGELGLSGEFRSSASVEQRVNEAVRLGFKTIALPKRCAAKTGVLPEDASLFPMTGIYDAMRIFREKEKESEA
jgi:DNA repair protein RadA/Sms